MKALFAMRYVLKNLLIAWTLCAIHALSWAQAGAGSAERSGTIDIIDYPMFQVGEPGPGRHNIDFFWSPTDVESSEVYRRLIKPVLMDPKAEHVINFYLLADDTDDEEQEDAQIGALLTCLPAARMPDFALSILEHNVKPSAIRDIEDLFEASRAYGNRRESLASCLLPRVVVKIAVASEKMRQVLDTDDATVVRVDGEDIDLDDTTLDEFLELLGEES